MNSNHSEVAAAWIVALALLAAMAVHAFLPETPPRLGYGVADAAAARVGTNLSGGFVVADPDLPLVELGEWLGIETSGAASSGDVTAGVPAVAPAAATPGR